LNPTTSPRIEVVRVYEDPGREPGDYRVLVDRLWPRGVRKDALRLDEWARDLAPSAELRRWYSHVVERFEEFARRYQAELALPAASRELARLGRIAHGQRLVLLTATRDVDHSGAKVLLQAISEALSKGDD
jgi:uncharacterized protein YeaO (DUF488 family)